MSVPFLLSALLAQACGSPPAPTAPPAPLPGGPGPHPLSAGMPCEASDAVRLPDGRFLIADNEKSSALYAASYRSDETSAPSLTVHGPLRLRQDDNDRRSIDDIEGLAPWAGGVLVVGSHSRKSWSSSDQRCPSDEDRRRIGLYQPQGDILVEQWRYTTSDREWSEATASADSCRTMLFNNSPTPAVGHFCDALVSWEAALMGPGAEAACGMGLNIEASAAIADHLWLGLRRPVHPEHGVPLLRLHTQHQPQARHLSLDAVAWLVLEGERADWGIRAMTTAGEWLLGISSPHDRTATSTAILWRLPITDVQPGASLHPQILRDDLNPSAEALVVGDGGLIVLTDGSEPRGDSSYCAEPSQQLHIPLETLTP